MTTVANCFDSSEALRLQIALAAAGISTFLPDENMATIAPNLFLSGSGVRIQVADEDAVAAQGIVSEQRRAHRGSTA